MKKMQKMWKAKKCCATQIKQRELSREKAGTVPSEEWVRQGQALNTLRHYSTNPSSSMIWKVDRESLAMATQLRAKMPYGAEKRGI